MINLRLIAILVISVGLLCILWGCWQMSLVLPYGNTRIFDFNSRLAALGAVTSFIGFSLFRPSKWGWYIAVAFFLICLFISLFFPFLIFLYNEGDFSLEVVIIGYYFTWPFQLSGVFVSYYALKLLAKNKLIFLSPGNKQAFKVKRSGVK